MMEALILNVNKESTKLLTGTFEKRTPASLTSFSLINSNLLTTVSLEVTGRKRERWLYGEVRV